MASKKPPIGVAFCRGVATPVTTSRSTHGRILINCELINFHFFFFTFSSLSLSLSLSIPFFILATLFRDVPKCFLIRHRCQMGQKRKTFPIGRLVSMVFFLNITSPLRRFPSWIGTGFFFFYRVSLGSDVARLLVGTLFFVIFSFSFHFF